MSTTPKTLSAVECIQCRTLHPEQGAYLIVTTTIVEHKEEEREGRPALAFEYKRREPYCKSFTNVVVCNNECLNNLLSIKSF